MSGYPDPRPVSAEIAELGEGARWDAAAGELLWVDIAGGVLRRAVEDGAGAPADERQRAAEPDAGRVFAVGDVGVTAPPVRSFHGRLPSRRDG